MITTKFSMEDCKQVKKLFCLYCNRGLWSCAVIGRKMEKYVVCIADLGLVPAFYFSVAYLATTA
jgi:hypothetical protein